jgi:hypothetical protein
MFWGLKRSTLLIVMLILLGTLPASGYAQTPTPDFEYINGHLVRGPFLEQYRGVPDPLLRYGYPITGEFLMVTERGQVTVQYFQRARFDLVRESDGHEHVVVADLGRLLYPGQGLLAPVPTDPLSCRFFENGKSVCYAFRQFYEAHDGLEAFGLPISDIEIAEGRYVQYFERARFEWRPENPPGERVVLTDLGKRHFDLVVRDFQLLRPEPPPDAIIAQLVPQVRAFVAQSLVPSGGEQTLYVIVRDQYERPIAGAGVLVTMVGPEGLRNTYRAVETDADGITRFTFFAGRFQPQTVITLQVKVTVLGSEAETQTWYRIWY